MSSFLCVCVCVNVLLKVTYGLIILPLQFLTLLLFLFSLVYKCGLAFLFLNLSCNNYPKLRKILYIRYMKYFILLSLSYHYLMHSAYVTYIQHDSYIVTEMLYISDPYTLSPPHRLLSRL